MNTSVGSEIPVLSLENVVERVHDAVQQSGVVLFESTVLNDMTILPLRIDAMIIALCMSGCGELEINLRKYKLTRGSLVFIQPNDFIGWCRFSDDMEVRIMACTRDVVEEIKPKFLDTISLLLHFRNMPVEDINICDVAELDTCFSFLKSLIRQGESPFSREKLICGLQASLFCLMEISLRNSTHKHTAPTRKEKLMARFIQILSENFRVNRQVEFYANALCVTPKHLSTVIKNLSGRTTGEWIANFVVMEAKVLLRNTDKTVAQIAEELNFCNQSFFGKYFRHCTGLSPLKYRQSLV